MRNKQQLVLVRSRILRFLIESHSKITQKSSWIWHLIFYVPLKNVPSIITTKISACSWLSVFVVDGVWEQWSEWAECSVSCGGGSQDRNRDCTGPFYGGLECPGNDSETRDCNTHHCPSKIHLASDGVFTFYILNIGWFVTAVAKKTLIPVQFYFREVKYLLKESI